LRVCHAAFPENPVATEAGKFQRALENQMRWHTLTVAGQWRILTAFPNTSCVRCDVAHARKMSLPHEKHASVINRKV
jgi:hypothetical protein